MQSDLVVLKLETSNAIIEASFNPLGARQVSLAYNGANALQPYDLTRTPPFATGFVMAPWANRMRDGSWTDSSGVTHVNPISEVRTNTALHGLLLETVYQVQDRTASSVTFATRILPTDGYPFDLSFSVTYELNAEGFTATHRATNHSSTPAPFQTGAHPYLVIEGTPTADLEIKVPAASWWRVDGRLLPVGVEPVGGTSYDSRMFRRLGDYCIDNGFTDLSPEGDGRTRTIIKAPASLQDKRVIAVWQDSKFPQVHIFSTPIYPAEPATGKVIHGITVEPVTAGPDAFNTGVDLIQLSPESEWAGSWGIQLLDW